MKKILYIGNKLSGHGVNRTTIETLGPLLEQAGFLVYTASSKKNKAFRLLDMVWKTLSTPANFVLIDTYSTSNFWYAVAVSQLCRLMGKPYIPILHGGELPRRLAKNPKLSAAVFKHAFVNVAPSGYLLEAFQRAGFENLVSIPNPVTITDYPFRQRMPLHPKLLWVRAFADIYNPQMAVRVLALLQKRYPQASLCMIGPIKDHSFEQTKALAHQLNLKVEFTGKLSKTAWIEKSSAHDIFINTTHYDNMPVSVVENMALGLAVVSTNVGGIPYLLKDGETAFLVPDNAAQEMCDAICKLLQDQEHTAKMVRAARVQAEFFDSAKVAAAWTEILN